MNTTQNINEELEKGITLPIMEDFYTIQGEGYHTGKAAYFIRIGGCDVGCHWCDVKESWDAKLHPATKVDLIVNKLTHIPAKSVVITGGEPCMYNLNYLTQQLHNKNIQTYLETSGAYKITGNWDWICLSPKKTNEPINHNLFIANELKVIVYNKNDFEWAEKNAKEVNNKCKLFLQPEWSKSNQILPDIINYVMNNPKWNISLQTHKYMNIP